MKPISVYGFGSDEEERRFAERLIRPRKLPVCFLRLAPGCHLGGSNTRLPAGQPPEPHRSTVAREKVHCQS